MEPSLLTKIKNCQLCSEYLPHKPRPVFQYHPNAKILIAGQAPGRKVHESGIPFNDASGDRLRGWMGVSKEIFYDEKKIAILPMAFCFPGSTKKGDMAPRAECAQTWRKHLLDGLKNKKLTILLGRYAIDYHMGIRNESLMVIVNSWKEYLPEYIPLPHPSPRNNIWLRKNPWFEKKVIPSLKDRVNRVLNVQLE